MNLNTFLRYSEDTERNFPSTLIILQYNVIGFSMGKISLFSRDEKGPGCIAREHLTKTQVRITVLSLSKEKSKSISCSGTLTELWLRKSEP